MLADDDRVLYANAAAESFFSLSHGMLKRQTLPDIIAFSSPLAALVAQVRRSGATVNEYGVDVALPRSGLNRLVDVFAGVMPDQPGLIVLMLQQRSMAQMIERQLTTAPRPARCRACAAVLAHEIKNPLSGSRGAAQLLEPGLKDETGRRTTINLHGDRTASQPGRPHGGVRRRAAPRNGAGNIHSVSTTKRLAETGFADGSKDRLDYDRRAAVPGNRDKLIQPSSSRQDAAEAIQKAASPA